MMSNELMDALYAADMKAQAATEVCESAGAELIHSGNGMWRWKRGEDNSYDESKGFFDTRDEAAIDFTKSLSFQLWLRARGVSV